MKKVITISLFWVLLVHQVIADNMLTKSIAINHVNARTLAQALQPILKKGETVSVFENQLIVHVSPQTLTQIRPLIHKLDKPKAMLLVSIHQDNANWLDSGYQQADTYSTSSQRLQRDNQSVKVLSGTIAYVSTGQNYPVIQSMGLGLWNNGVSYERMQSDKGFFIKPLLQGNRVKLLIKRQYNQQNPVNEQAASNSAFETTMTVPIDKWVKLSETSATEQHHNGDAYQFRTGGNFDNKGSFYIKINRVRQ